MFDELRQRIPLSKNTALLREPLTTGGFVFPNRLAIQAMEGADGTADGAPGELTLRRYDRFAKSGAGLLWFEATAVRHDGRANPHQLFLHEKNLDTYKKLVAGIRETAYKENGFNPILIMQATHSGRYSKPDGKPKPMIACNNPLYEGETPLSPEYIISDDTLQRIEEDYAHTARLAQECGFDGMDVKACHRYLNNELLSAVTRSGPYGGCLENRSRFFKNCVANARAATSDGFTITSRMNIYDGIPHPYGFGVNSQDGLEPDLSEPIEVIRAMDFPFINITMGNPYFNPQVNRPTDLAGVERMYLLTRKVREACPNIAFISSAPTFVRENSPYLAAGAVEQGYADIVGYGRMSFAYPFFARDTLQDQFDRKQTCLACGKCTELMRFSKAGCAVRDPIYTALYKELQSERKAT